MQKLKRHYVFLALLGLFACFYSYYRSGISSPVFPSLLTSKLKALSSGDQLVLSKTFSLTEDTSDRKLSQVTRYTFHDGSQLFAVMVRVRKRDDFKIETYGLLTKGIDLIYIQSPFFSSAIPYSMKGSIKGVKTLQTCVIPGTTKLEQANVQLFPLLSEADRLAGSSKSILSKLLGTDDRSDYACLVLTFQPNSIQTSIKHWQAIVNAAQLSMSSPSTNL